VTAAPEKPPAGLGKAGRALWRDVRGTYGISTHDGRLLEAVCATVDALDCLDRVVASEGVMSTGSKGQPVLHPAVAEARQQRLALGRLLAQLALPDLDQAGEIVRSPQQLRAQRAAQERWRRHRRTAGVA
jgi:hypothetical protein